MAKITDLIKPFKTKLEIPHTLSPEEMATISIKKGTATIYDDGVNKISVPIWGYNGQFPGPTIETRRDKTIYIKWVNNIKQCERNPCKADIVGFKEGQGNTIPQNILDPGSNDPKMQGEPSNGANGQAFVATHLHGGKTPPNYDGWPESMLLPKKEGEDGQSRLCQYENKQRAMMLWYHDHAMHTTRLNAYVGLAGLWIIRDEEEDELDLPKAEYEIPLVIQDRNLTDFNDFCSQTDRAKLLHRVENVDGPLEFFGPLTLVNGCIWPKHEVKAKAYRLRLLNASNSRFYRLRFAEKLADDSYVWCEEIQVKQIGSDNGLMQQAVELPPKGLILAPAERVDLIVDFSTVQGKNIVLLNTAEAPFSNAEALELSEMFPDDPASYTVNDEAWRTPYPQVMMFEVEDCSSTSQFDFECLARDMLAVVTSFEREDPLIRWPEVGTQVCRTVVLVEKTVHVGTAMEQVILVQWELAKKADIANTSMAILSANREIIIDGEEFVVTAERFEDPVNWIIKHGSTEKWRFINLTEDTHPMHVHLVQFRPVSRNEVMVEGVTDDIGVVDVVNENSQANQPIVISTGNPGTLDDNEKYAYKDTVRVNPGEVVEIIATFEGYCGRYVYHCHLLEHEDHDMMRQFVVTRDDMDMGEHGLPISVGINNLDSSSSSSKTRVA